MPITIYPGSMKKRNANGSYSDLVPAIATDPEVLDDFAEEYSTSETYNIGDYCIHNSDLYKCNTNNTTGTWNSNAWDHVTVGDELVDHKNTLSAIKSDLTSNYQTSPNCSMPASPNKILRGEFFYLDGILVTALTDINDTAAFTSGTNYEVVTAGGLNALKNEIGLRFFTGTMSNVSISIPVGASEIQFPAPSNAPAIHPKFIWIRFNGSRVITLWECYPDYVITNNNAWYFNAYNGRDSSFNVTTYDYIVAY